jgi:hypothetical protein
MLRRAFTPPDVRTTAAEFFDFFSSKKAPAGSIAGYTGNIRQKIPPGEPEKNFPDTLFNCSNNQLCGMDTLQRQL